MTIREQAFQGKALSPFIIDAHTHLSPYYKLGWHQHPGRVNLRALMENYDRLGIDCCVTAPHQLCDSMSTWACEVAADAAKEYPGRIYGYISVAPFEGMDVLKENLTRFGRDPAFVGLKFLGGYNGTYSDPVYQYAADFADEMRCPLLCHTWENNPPLAEMQEMAEKRPGLKLIMAHLGGGSREMTVQAAALIRQIPNLYMDICGSLYNELGIEEVVELTGGDRVIFGTDAFNLGTNYDLGRLAFSPLEDCIKEKIFSGNFLKLLETSQMGRIRKQ